MIVHGYHGTPETCFEVSEIKKRAFFSKNIETASYFARNGGRILYARIEAEKVLEFDAEGESWGSGVWTGNDDIDTAIWNYIVKHECIDKDGNINEEEMEYWKENGPTLDYIASWAEEQGYDLIIAHAVYDDDADATDTNYIALNNAVIKPCEGN